MCFSAKASFIASISLGFIGLATLKQVKKKTQLLFALIPLMFSIQQFSEGLIWLLKDNFSTNHILIKSLSYIFLNFALIIWPIVIPLSLYNLEEDKSRRSYLKMLLSLGLSWAILFSVVLLKEQVFVAIECSHIYYNVHVPFYKNYNLALTVYGMTTILPFFISTRKSMKIFGTLLLFSCLISYVCWYNYLTSVWCFFAALLSLSVYVIIKWQNIKENYLTVLNRYKNLNKI